MAANKLDTLIETVKSLTLMEAADAVKRLKEELNLPDMPTMMAGAMPVAAAAGAEVEEKTEFDVMLESCPADKKISVLKVVREITGLGLGEAKTLVESAPKEVKIAVAKAEAEEMKKKIEAAGGVVKLK